MRRWPGCGDDGWIERVQDAQSIHPGKPRKAYRLTPLGQRVVQAETARLQALMLAAQQRLGAGLANLLGNGRCCAKQLVPLAQAVL